MYVKIKWQTGIQKTLHRFVPSSSLWLCDFYQQSRFLTACRRLEKLVLPTFLTQVFHPWWYETCTIIQQQFWMKECDILGGQNILWSLLHIFRGSRPFNPGIYAPDLQGYTFQRFRTLKTALGRICASLRSHWIWGGGSPVNVHLSTTLRPSATDVFCSGSMNCGLRTAAQRRTTPKIL